jgi:hypothetical protein
MYYFTWKCVCVCVCVCVVFCLHNYKNAGNASEINNVDQVQCSEVEADMQIWMYV